MTTGVNRLLTIRLSKIKSQLLAELKSHFIGYGIHYLWINVVHLIVYTNFPISYKPNLAIDLTLAKY